MSSRLAARLLATAALTAGLVPVVGGTSWACSCVAADTAQHARESAKVYSGTITEITQLAPTDAQGSLAYAYTVDVETVVKGEPGEHPRVASPAGAAGCGIVLEKGPVIVFDRKGDGNVDLCDGTTQDRVPEVTRVALAALKPPGESPHGAPVSESDTKEKKSSSTEMATALGAMLVAAIAAIAFSRGEGGEPEGH